MGFIVNVGSSICLFVYCVYDHLNREVQVFYLLHISLFCPKFLLFCPIAMCNILYKLVSKVLANWLKKFLPEIISDSQSAFQTDKAIFDNILVAFETLHHMKNKKARKSGFMTMKLDISKTYDRVEWDFLCLLMKKMGFHKRWINQIFGCISFVSYSILVNGEPQVDFKPSRGIRQGDPLSPYLFLLCLEGLNGLIQKHVATCDIRGFSLCRDSP